MSSPDVSPESIDHPQFGSAVRKATASVIDGRMWLGVDGRQVMFPVSSIGLIQHHATTPPVSVIEVGQDRRYSTVWHVLTETLPVDLQP